MENASVEFDVETLSPTFKLSIGLPGRSNAFAIAERLGLSEAILDRARALISAEDAGADVLLANVKAASEAAAQERSAAEETHRQARALEQELRLKLSQIEEARRAVIADAREQARQELEHAAQRAARLAPARRPAQSGADPVKEILKAIDRMEERIEHVEPAGPPREALLEDEEELRAGDRVWVPSLGQEGVLQEIEGDSALVSLGGFRLRTELDRLQFRGRSLAAEAPVPDSTRPAPDDRVAGVGVAPARPARGRGARVGGPLRRAGLPLRPPLGAHRARQGRRACSSRSCATSCAAIPWSSRSGAGSSTEGGEGITVVILENAE